MLIQRAPRQLAALLLFALAVRPAAGEQPQDAALAITLDAPHEVFSSGEPVTGSIAVPAGVGPVEQVMLQWRVTPARSGAVLHQGTHTARLTAVASPTPTIPFEIPLPPEEGVYDLQLTLFAGAEPRHATVQVVVVSPLPRGTSPERHAAPRLVDAFSIPRDARRTGDRTLRLRTGRPGLPHRVVASFTRGGAEPELTIVGAIDDAEIASRAAILPTTTPAGAAEGFETREFIFWPRNEAPLLVLQHAGAISRIDVCELPSLPPASPLSCVVGQNVPSRWIGPRLRSSDLCEHFATGGERNPLGRDPDDWVTLHAAGLRLVEALHASGANGLLLAVPAGPGAAMRHDSDKDIVEFLYRLCEREGLTLLPELQFSAPLPELETLRIKGGAAARGVELIGRDGRTWHEHNRSHRSGSLYNPLHPAVQEAVLAVLGEFVARYAPREGFRGVAVALNPVGYLRFPSLEWGYDDETVTRFERETKLTVPAGPAEGRYQRRYEYLTGPARAQWVRWRAAELAAFHRRMADLVTAAKLGARLVLSRRGQPHSNLLNVEDGPPSDLFVDAGTDGPLSLLPGVRRAGAPPARERLAHALAAADLQMAFGADWIVTRGNDAGSWELRRTLQALPAIAFHRHEPVPQPVVIRVGRAGEKTFLYALNDFPGAVSLDVQLSCPADTPCRPLGLSDAARLEKGVAPGSSLRLQLEPFALWAGEIAGAAVRITGANVAVDEPARARLQSRLARFAARVTEIQQAGRPAPDVQSVPVDAEQSGTTEPITIPPGKATLWHWTGLDEDRIELTSGRREPPGGADSSPLMVVRLVARADADSTPLRLAVGTDAAGDVQSEAVSVQASRSPARYSFPCKGLSGQGHLAVRIENRGTAPVRIDAVELRSYRITPDDLRELTKTVSALSLAWEERRYADCHRLLESDWGRLPFSEEAVSSRLAQPVEAQPAISPAAQP